MFSVCIRCVVSGEWGCGEWLSVLRCLMRPLISGVKLGLWFFLLPLGIYFLSAFCMIVLKVCTAASMSVMGVLFSVAKCCSVSLVKSSQLALL